MTGEPEDELAPFPKMRTEPPGWDAAKWWRHVASCASCQHFYEPPDDVANATTVEVLPQ